MIDALVRRLYATPGLIQLSWWANVARWSPERGVVLGRGETSRRSGTGSQDEDGREE